MTLKQQFNRQLARQHLLTPQVTLIVAVSTGVDSMVLLDLLQQVPVEQRPRLVVAHVNHHLRVQSAQEVAFLTKYCAQRQLTLERADWLAADHPATGVEAAGRAFRYEFFAELMAKYQAAAVLTAHHANDQTETYLMKLARGGDLAQLTGIQPQRQFATGLLVRPLLPWPKATLRAYAQDQRLPFFEDATNQDVRLTRNRVRHQVVPALTKVNPALLAHVASYEQQLADLLTAQAEMVATLLPTVMDENDALVIDKLQQLPPHWRLVTLQRWLEQRTGEPFSTVKLQPTYRWLSNRQQPQGTLRLNARVEIVKVTSIIDIIPTKKRVKKLMPPEKIMVDLNQWQKITATQVAGVFTDPITTDSQPFRLMANDGQLAFRPWRADDYLTLKGGGHQRVRRILIDQKVPPQSRDQVMVLVNTHGTVLWLVGYKFSYRDQHAGSQTVFLALKHTELKGVHLKR